MKSIIWFRNDLRIDDNPALKAACENSIEVNAVFIYSQKQLENHNEANVKLDFLIDNLKCLSNSLEELNIPLSIIDSKGFDEDPEIILQTAKERDVAKYFLINSLEKTSKKEIKKLQLY